jgi:2-polyprenyl-3-methyl-5-hydroxy-6-metoxy-1,4-benzoquinol methylase
MKNLFGQKAKTLQKYVHSAPSNQNILDIFQGEWSTKIPEKYNLVTQPGFAPLFDDPRIKWAEEELGPFRNLKILELGPLEGAHSYQLQQTGAAQVISVEANKDSFLKCLCIKEIFKMDKVEFKLGDFVAYLKSESTTFDVIIACGVLYHLMEPVELIRLLAASTQKVFIWTHYFDENRVTNNKTIKSYFSGIKTGIYEEIQYTYALQHYRKALRWEGFCGGSARTSKWLSKESIIEALKHYGFTHLSYNFHDTTHMYGNAIGICASKE